MVPFGPSSKILPYSVSFEIDSNDEREIRMCIKDEDGCVFQEKEDLLSNLK